MFDRYLEDEDDSYGTDLFRRYDKDESDFKPIKDTDD